MGSNREAEKVILKLLSDAPLRWGKLDVDSLTAAEEEAMKLVLAAGMVERRFSICLSLIGHEARIEATAQVTGEYGLVLALEPVIQKSWKLWGDFFQERRDGPEEEKPIFHCENTGTWNSMHRLR